MNSSESLLTRANQQDEEYEAPQIADSSILGATYGSTAGSADSNGQGQC